MQINILAWKLNTTFNFLISWVKSLRRCSKHIDCISYLLYLSFIRLVNPSSGALETIEFFCFFVLFSTEIFKGTMLSSIPIICIYLYKKYITGDNTNYLPMRASRFVSERMGPVLIESSSGSHKTFLFLIPFFALDKSMPSWARALNFCLLKEQGRHVRRGVLPFYSYEYEI